MRQLKAKLSQTRHDNRIAARDDRWLTLADLQHRAADAARVTLGRSLRDHRADCIATIIAQTLEQIGTRSERAPMVKVIGESALSPFQRACIAEASPMLSAAPDARADDPRVSFTALRFAAQKYRDRVVLPLIAREREQDAAERDGRAQQATRSGVEQMVRDDEQAREAAETTAQGARALADTFADALRRSPDSVCDGNRYPNVWRWLYVAARGADESLCAAELSLSSAALRKSMQRARAIILDRYPIDPTDPQHGADAFSNALAAVWLEPTQDRSEARPSGHRKHYAGWSAREPRSGTAAGEYAERFDNADEARAACTLRKRADAIGTQAAQNERRRAKRALAKVTDADRAAAASRLARAHAQARRSNLPTKPLATKSGHAGETGVRG